MKYLIPITTLGVVNPSLCISDIMLPLQAFINMGAQDILIDKDIASQMGCALVFWIKP